MKQPAQNPDLAEYDIAALISEIQARCPASVLVASVPDNDDECETRFYTNGNRYCLLGMLEVAKAGLLADTLGDREAENDDEDES